MPETRTQPKVVLLAGGGSGGHVSPAIAIAERLTEQSPDSRVLHACSNRPVDAMMLSRAGSNFTVLAARPFTVHPFRAPGFFASFLRSRSQCEELIRREGVETVVAVGGFVAAPAVAAARRCRAKTVLINLDDPPGRANRWIAKHADVILSAVGCRDLCNRSVDVSGVPLRREVVAGLSRIDCCSRLGLDPECRALLVTGASQGAGTINMVLPMLVYTAPDLFRGWQILHLAGPGQEASVRDAYSCASCSVHVLPFLHEIGIAWGAADLAISRAGANSVAEAAANCVPTVFLPYPHHADEHQRRNAEPLVESGGAVIVRDMIEPQENRAPLESALADLMQSDGRLDAMRSALRARPQIDAAARMADRILNLA